MRQLCVVALTLTLLEVATAQSLRIDERASRVALTGRRYGVLLFADATNSSTPPLSGWK
jgi:hypothetical protein